MIENTSTERPTTFYIAPAMARNAPACRCGFKHVGRSWAWSFFDELGQQYCQDCAKVFADLSGLVERLNAFDPAKLGLARPCLSFGAKPAHGVCGADCRTPVEHGDVGVALRMPTPGSKLYVTKCRRCLHANPALAPVVTALEEWLGVAPLEPEAIPAPREKSPAEVAAEQRAKDLLVLSDVFASGRPEIRGGDKRYNPDQAAAVVLDIIHRIAREGR
jgi:hypothetical protein